MTPERMLERVITSTHEFSEQSGAILVDFQSQYIANWEIQPSGHNGRRPIPGKLIPLDLVRGWIAQIDNSYLSIACGYSPSGKDRQLRLQFGAKDIREVIDIPQTIPDLRRLVQRDAISYSGEIAFNSVAPHINIYCWKDSLFHGGKSLEDLLRGKYPLFAEEDAAHLGNLIKRAPGMVNLNFSTPL